MIITNVNWRLLLRGLLWVVPTKENIFAEDYEVLWGGFGVSGILTVTILAITGIHSDLLFNSLSGDYILVFYVIVFHGISELIQIIKRE